MAKRSVSIRIPALAAALAVAIAAAAAMRAQQQAPQGPRPVVIKPVLPSGPLASGEKLIPLPGAKSGARTRKAAPAAPEQLTEEQKILHLLNRAGFGPRPGDIERVRRMGIDRYLEEQLHPEEIDDSFLNKPLQALNTLQMSIPETIQFFAPPPPPPAPTPAVPAIPAAQPPATVAEGRREELKDAAQEQRRKEAMPAQEPPRQAQPAQPRPTPPPRDPQTPLRELQQAKLARAVFSERQLQEVMVDFWINHFNVFAGKDNMRWMVTSYERDIIRPRALGRFRDLLLAVAQSPAMLYYLDNFLSQAEPRAQPPAQAGPPPGPMPENPALQQPQPPPPPRRPGLNENYARELLELHTLGVDGGYTQQDVIEVARCFTGWTITPQPNAAFVFRPRVHDRGEKMVLGRRIREGGGIEDGLSVIELVSSHPSTARFIATKLCRRFVSDDPPASLVAKVAEVFKRTDGDIREMVRTILASPEFNSPKHYRNKVKSPLELVASALRASAASTDAAPPLLQWLARMGEPLYQCQPPTGYSEDSMRWLSNATLLERMNFALALAGGRINGTRLDPGLLVPLEAEPGDRQLLDALIPLLVHSDVSAETRAGIAEALARAREALGRPRPEAQAARKYNEQLATAAASLILGSREFQMK